MPLPVWTRTGPSKVGLWSNAAAIVQESDRHREEEVRKRVEEDEAKGVVPAERSYNVTWKQFGVCGGSREIVRVERPQAAAAAAPASALLPHQRRGPAAPPAEAAVKPLLPHLRRPT